VVGVPTDFQAYGGGGIGCITQQLPAGPFAP
jgi:agmatine/peptidylarginine deiminase